jgi:glycine/D-amino acid oxidase-like deaminating enzyme
MTKYGRSPWIDWFPASRVPSKPRFRGRLDAEVVVVGAGLTGCATAYAFAAAGIPVVLLEAGRLGRGATAYGAGWIGDDPGVRFGALEKAVGRRAARRAWQAWHRAGLDLAALLRRLSIKCALEPRGLLTVALDSDQALHLAREKKARREAGLEAPLVNARVVSADVGLVASAGIRAYDGATVDPYRAALGLASAAVARGARCFERSPVTRIRFDRKAADVYTDAGSIRAARVVVATGAPTPLFEALRRHFKYRRTYLVLTAPVPARVRQRLGRREIVVRDSVDPSHIVRWVDDERLLVMGADAAPPPDRRREKVVIQRTGQLMYELSTLYPDISGILPEYGWDAPYARTSYGLPCIGPHRNYPHHLFAFGDASRSVTGAYLASRILLRYHMGEVEPADEAFAFRL